MELSKDRVLLAAKLYRCHDSMKSLFGDKFPVKIKPYTDFLKELNTEDPLLGVLAVCKIPEIKNDDMAVILFMAAAVELM